MSSDMDLFLKHLAPTSLNPLLLEVADSAGIFIFDKSGRSYIDLISGVSVSNLGHQNPEIIGAVKDQAGKYMHLMVYGEYIQSPQLEYAKLLTRLLPENLNCIYLVNSGSEAVEGALKLAKKFTGRFEIIAMKNAYHGSTHGTLSIMGNESLKNSFRPLLPGIKFIEFNNPGEIERITVNTACVITEPIQGEAGIIVPDEKYLELLREQCNKTGTLLIFDEVQTGFGRTGSMFAFMHYKAIPDILVIAKAMGGGMPLGGFVASHKMMQSFADNPPLGHITTFGGHPVSCAAALACLKILIRENFVKDAQQKEMLFRRLLVHPMIKSVRGKGLLLAVEVDEKIVLSGFQQRCLMKGLITDWFLFCDSAFRISPPLVITDNEIERSCNILLNVLNEY